MSFLEVVIEVTVYPRILLSIIALIIFLVVIGVSICCSLRWLKKKKQRMAAAKACEDEEAVDLELAKQHNTRC